MTRIPAWLPWLSRWSPIINRLLNSRVARRVWEHREGMIPGFTKRYGVKMLVHSEEFGDIRDAIDRETRLKKWKRQADSLSHREN